MANQTYLKGHVVYKEALVQSGVGAQALKPGMLLQLNSDGTVQAHGTAGGRAQCRFCMENELMGQGLSGSNYAGVAVGYTGGDTALYFVADKGAELQGLVANNAPAIAVGDLLESAGDGTLRKCSEDLVTDSTGGTPSATFAAITAGAGYAQADMVAVKNALAQIAVLFNVIKGSVVGVALQALTNTSGANASIKLEAF